MKSVLKLTPILLLAGLVISGTDVLAAAPIAALYAGIICVLTEKITTTEIIDKAIDNAKSGMMVFFILMVAYALAEVFMVTGVGAAIISISIKLGVTARSIAVVTFLSTCILSVSTGTSWGTFAACAPIFLWLNHVLGGSVSLTLCAAAGGAAFGDNIGLISDTTIFSSGIQNVNVVDRVRHQGVWSLLCVFTSAILFYVTSMLFKLPTTVGNAAQAIGEIPDEAWTKLEEIRPSAVALLQQVQTGVPLYMVIPIVLVIGLAIGRKQTLICLSAGIFSAFFLGAIAGTITSFSQAIDLIYTGFSDAGSWVVIMMMWVTAFGGIMNSMNAFEPIAKGFLKISNNVKQLMTCNALLCIIGNAALSDEVAQMATIGPVIKNVVDNHVEGSKEDKYVLALRNATFSDALGVLGSELIPWHVCAIYYVSLAQAVYPLYTFHPIDLIKFNYMAIISVVSMMVLTFTGMDRLIPLFKLPSEPNVRLIKDGMDRMNKSTI
ncbi:Na+/H+ antiporter NhaC family protein [Clostridiaceae bacterium 35-E11]